MSRDFSNSANYLSYASYPFPNASGEVCVWVNPSWDGDDDASHVFVHMGDSTNYFRIHKDGSDNKLYCGWAKGASFCRTSVDATNLFKSGYWTGITCSWRSATFAPGNSDRVRSWVWPQYTSTQTYTFANSAAQMGDLSAGTLYVGRSHGGTAANALIAKVGIWSDVVYNGTDLSELSVFRHGLVLRRGGISPTLLQDYWPILGNDDPEINWSALNPGRTLTVNGTPTKGSNDPAVPGLTWGYRGSGGIFDPETLYGTFLQNPDLKGGLVRGLYGGF